MYFLHLLKLVFLNLLAIPKTNLKTDIYQPCFFFKFVYIRIISVVKHHQISKTNPICFRNWETVFSLRVNHKFISTKFKKNPGFLISFWMQYLARELFQAAVEQSFDTKKNNSDSDKIVSWQLHIRYHSLLMFKEFPDLAFP